MDSLFEIDICKLKGVGPKRARLFEKLGAPTVGDLLRLYPRLYEDWSCCTPIAQTVIGEISVISATVLARPIEQRVKGGLTIYKATATDGEKDITLTFFNNRYIPNLLLEGRKYVFRGKVQGTFFRREMVSPEFISAEKVLSFVPVYPQTEGLSTRLISAALKEALRLLPQANPDPIPHDIRLENKLCHINFALENVHFPVDRESAETARERLIFEELLVLQLGMRMIRKRSTALTPHVLSGNFTGEFCSLLPFNLTGAQRRAIDSCCDDMKSGKAMNRLLQGDVGSGKTAVAAALCFNGFKNGFQCAFMAPTEILANQHYHSLSSLLAGSGVNVALLTGSVTKKNKERIYADLKEGRIHLVIGTHALISEGVTFKNLGLVITDEQHRFGVDQRSALAKKGAGVHMLVMSATPIPRTLALMIYGDLDISVLDELPPGRQKIETYAIDSPKRLRAFSYIQKHLDEGRQGYIVCPLIEEGISDVASVNEYFEFMTKHFDESLIAVLHGKIKPREKDAVMDSFMRGEKRLLLSTTVVEVGVDVPNAVIMLIENAERYGLSQLHQLRGRVGRGKHKSTCILVTDAQNDEATERMKLMCSTCDGFKIADADLKMRGPGDFFGSRQHGLPKLKIADMAKDMEVLKKARLSAESILKDDPVLKRHPLLLLEIKRLFTLSGNSSGMVL